MQQNEAENMYSENQVFNPQDTPVKAVNDAYLLLQNYLNNYCGGLQAYALTSVFYIDPLHKKMYYIHSDIHTTIDLSIFNYLFTSNIYCVNENYIKEIYDALFNLLIEQAKINPVLPLYNRFVHVHKKFFFQIFLQINFL